jgi:hypothetical protein
MFRRLLQTGIIFGCCFLLSSPHVHAARKERKEKPKKEFTVVHTKFALIPKLTIGLLTGEAADKLEGSKNTSVFGGGFNIEYSLSPLSRLGLNLELVYGQSHKAKFDNKNGKVRSLSYSGSWLLLFAPRNRSSLFTKAELGFSQLKPINPGYYESQTKSFFRVGLGHSGHFGPRKATRFELYYKHLFTDGSELERDGQFDTLDFNVNYVGLEFSMSFSI